MSAGSVSRPVGVIAAARIRPSGVAARCAPSSFRVKPGTTMFTVTPIGASWIASALPSASSADLRRRGRGEIEVAGAEAMGDEGAHHDHPPAARGHQVAERGVGHAEEGDRHRGEGGGELVRRQHAEARAGRLAGIADDLVDAAEPLPAAGNQRLGNVGDWRDRRGRSRPPSPSPGTSSATARQARLRSCGCGGRGRCPRRRWSARSRRRCRSRRP